MANSTVGDIPKTMRAWTFTSTGAPRDVLSLTSDNPVPSELSGNQILVRIAYTTISPAAIMTMMVPIGFGRARIPELEFSGHIVAMTEGAQAYDPNGLKVGDAVWGGVPVSAAVLGTTGTLAEYVRVTAYDLLPMPSKNITMAEAAGLVGNGQTALKFKSLAEYMGVKLTGARVLVNGASGGVGSMGVQVVKAAGAETVVAVCSGKNADFVRGLGADDVIDYTAGDTGAQLKAKFEQQPFDLVFDTMGNQALFEASPPFLKPKGVFLNCGQYMHGNFWTTFYMFKNTFLPRLLGGTPRRYRFYNTPIAKEQSQELAKLVEEGKLKVPVEHTYAMEDVLDGYDRIQSRRTRGKLVVDVKGKKST